MIRFALILAAVGISGLYGCSACCGPYDFDYPVVGGMHQRANPTSGRVGSRFSDPFYVGGPSADSNLESPPEPRIRSAEPDDSDDVDDLEELDRRLDEAEEDLDLDMIDDDELEPIEPMRDSDLEEELDNLDRSDTESTAFNRWRARPLRQR